MSEIKLNLTDSQTILQGTIHGSVGDACVAALSAEPETIAELETALARYIKPTDSSRPFASFHPSGSIDTRAWDAGIVVIDLAGRIVASESTYSYPSREGQVNYHDGVNRTDIPVLYRVPEDWLFLDSIEQYECLREERRLNRVLPLDTRAILYGRPLLEFIARETTLQSEETIPALHARWLITPREDLRNQSPREVLLAKQDFIDFDLHTRSLQWSLLREGPPCLSTNSFAYRFAGFGTHEWVIYYYLVRYLLSTAITSDKEPATLYPQSHLEQKITELEALKTDWLEQPQEDYNGKIPALLIENERKRLPIAMLGHDMVIDEDCPMCQMMADDSLFGMDVGFWHLDGCNMDDDFAFSHFRTREEWEAERRKWEEQAKKFSDCEA